MTAEKLLPIVVAFMYLTTAFFHCRKGEHPAGVMFICYAIANVATVIAISQGSK